MQEANNQYKNIKMNYLLMVIYLILNLDWKPVPIIPKFVDIVVNGIAERTYDIKAYSQDPFGVKKELNIWSLL